MKEKIISEINLDLVFKYSEFPQFSNKLKDSKNKLIFEGKFWGTKSLGFKGANSQKKCLPH